MTAPIQQHRYRYVSTTVRATETPRFHTVLPSRRGRAGVTIPREENSPWPGSQAF
jgi:hypothetical protein